MVSKTSWVADLGAAHGTGQGWRSIAFRPAAAVCAAAVCALAITACGGARQSSGHSAGAYGPANSPAAVSRCMRANGVSHFPDPIGGPGGEGLPLMVNTDGSLTVEGQTFAGPALKHAERACSAYLPPSGGPPPAVSASQKARALAFARCMRVHGVPSFPDPSFAPAGAPAAQTADIDPSAPAVQAAARACGGAGGGSNFQIPG